MFFLFGRCNFLNSKCYQTFFYRCITVSDSERFMVAIFRLPVLVAPIQWHSFSGKPITVSSRFYSISCICFRISPFADVRHDVLQCACTHFQVEVSQSCVRLVISHYVLGGSIHMDKKHHVTKKINSLDSIELNLVCFIK